MGYDKDGDPPLREEPSVVLRRVSSYHRTVRYERSYGGGRVMYEPAFVATLQEWARARD